jgi:hypothetical protein
MILLAIPAGLAAGALAWLAAGGASATARKLEPVATEVAALRRPRPQTYNPGPAEIAELSGLPIFTLTTGPGAVPQPVLRLDGLVRSRTHTAALLSVNDKPAEWLGVGERRDGVTLQQVMGSRVVVDTPYGLQDVVLGEAPPPAAAAPASPTSPRGDRAQPGDVPPGFRSPPPPASAPRPH